MFNNARYITRGIKSDIPIELQLFMWSCIDALKGELELDYLQVFELRKVKEKELDIQMIEHRQEVPKYSTQYWLFRSEIVEVKIFVIDDGDHSTMLLANEY